MRYLKTFENFHNDITQFTLSKLGNNNDQSGSNVSKEDLDQLKKKDINHLTELETKSDKQLIKRFRKKRFKKKDKPELPTDSNS